MKNKLVTIANKNTPQKDITQLNKSKTKDSTPSNYKLLTTSKNVRLSKSNEKSNNSYNIDKNIINDNIYENDSKSFIIRDKDCLQQSIKEKG